MSVHAVNLSKPLRFVNSNPLTHLISALLLNEVAMDVYEIRKANLLILEAEAESLKAIGDAMVRVVQERGEKDRAPDYANVLSQHKGGKRMGAQTARLIEAAMKKDRGWMDSLQSAKIDEAMHSKEAGQIANNISDAEKRELWLSLGRKFADESPKRSAGNPFGSLPKGGKPKRSGGTQ